MARMVVVLETVMGPEYGVAVLSGVEPSSV